MEYFTYSTTFPAPICGDESTGYIEATSPQQAWEKQRLGMVVHDSQGDFDWMFYCAIYASADDYHKSKQPLFESHTERAKAWLKKRKEA